MYVCSHNSVSSFAFYFLSFIEMKLYVVFWDIFPT